MLDRFLSVFGVGSVAYLCADREFVGGIWLRYLRRQGIGFRLRIRGNTRLTNARGRKVSARGLFWQSRIHQGKELEGRRLVWGQPVFVSGMRLPAGEFVIVISDKAAGLHEYALRWGIETLFGCLKSRGFCLEATHVTQPDRLSKLLALLALAFCWAFVAGMWLWEQKPLKIKKHGRRAMSLFRYGLDWLRRVLTPLCGRSKQADFQIAVSFLSCT